MFTPTIRIPFVDAELLKKFHETTPTLDLLMDVPLIETEHAAEAVARKKVVSLLEHYEYIRRVTGITLEDGVWSVTFECAGD